MFFSCINLYYLVYFLYNIFLRAIATSEFPSEINKVSIYLIRAWDWYKGRTRMQTTNPGADCSTYCTTVPALQYTLYDFVHFDLKTDIQ